MPPRAAFGGVDALSIVMGLGFALMWSSAFTSARIIMKDCGLAVCWPPFQTLAMRFLISGSLGCAIALTKRQTWKDLTGDQWKSIVVFGTCQNALYLGLNFVAMQSIEASLAAIMAATMPLLVAVLECVGLKKRIKPLGIFGLFAGIGGVAIIMGSRFSAEGGVAVSGVLLCAIASLALAVATLAVRSASGSGGNVILIVGLQMGVGSVIMAVCGVLFEREPMELSLRVVGAFFYTTLVPGLAATFVRDMHISSYDIPVLCSAPNRIDACLSVSVANCNHNICRMLYCVVMYRTALCCIALCCAALWYALHCIALYCRCGLSW